MMKKILMICLTVFMLAFVGACGSGDVDDNETQVDKQSEASQDASLEETKQNTEDDNQAEEKNSNNKQDTANKFLHRLHVQQ